METCKETLATSKYSFWVSSYFRHVYPITVGGQLAANLKDIRVQESTEFWVNADQGGAADSTFVLQEEENVISRLLFDAH